jgi:CheY-like chemotaxis protein|tara:strand:- start:1614 stop:1979 length:366 start_codon:yes stop_codon:yes gene_type:complete
MNSTILTVNMDKTFTEQVSSVFEKIGISVISSTNGLDGLNQARAVNPDLVITDITLPYLNGFHLCKLLKNDERFDHIPVVFASINDDQDTQYIVNQVGADAFIKKPVTNEALVRELIRILP